MRKTICIIITVFIAIFAMSTNSHAADIATGTDLVNELKAATAEESVVTLTSDIEVEAEKTIQSKGIKTLDLNGHTLTIKNTKFILVTGELKITGNGTITTDNASSTLGVNPGGKLTIENGNICNNRAGGMVISIWGSDNDNGTRTGVTVGAPAHLVGNNGIAIYNDRVKCYGVEVNLNGSIQANRRSRYNHKW